MDTNDVFEYSQQFLLKLLPGIIHELNSPAQFIFNNLEFVKSEIPPEEAALAEVRDAVTDSIEGIQTISTFLEAVSIIMSDFYQPFQTYSGDELLKKALFLTRNEWKYRFKLEPSKEQSGFYILCSPAFLMLSLCLVIVMLTEDTKSEGSAVQQTLHSEFFIKDGQAVFLLSTQSGVNRSFQTKQPDTAELAMVNFMMKNLHNGQFKLTRKKNVSTGILTIPAEAQNDRTE